VELFGHQFEIGPQTFFPSNLPTTEKLLKLLRPLSKLKLEDTKNDLSTFSDRRRSKKVTLLEVGCGAGIHSILLANGFHHCVGFDSHDVSDAINNAKTFGVSNKCSFLSGPYLKTFPQHLRNLENEAGYGVVILNPGRAAVDRELIGLIRGCSLIKKVIYISGKPEGESFNCFRDLCREVTRETKKNKYSIVPISRHFLLSHAFPVDLHPHTAHCEHALVFNRY
jgi:tRNA/tmRNA/rRNA uracil-C5-methylase (TrmA/RlmC/RlmD family)